ncbi:DUF5797 family protein [Natronoarchaeum sp. GCM10025703]|uniref:DUF5797 family protein n=1 Tax=Natronoarchaeum sp. GCM10025703 TaxID=3252685 RepID=UPI00361EACBE
MDVAGEQAWRKRFSGSVNTAEVDVVADLVAHLVDEQGVNESELGVITPYRGQRTLISDELSDYGNVEVSTVDGFQGRERETILFSAVNTEKYGLQFSGNQNRFNVACTRPKDQFIMVGNQTAIEDEAPWQNTLRAFIRYASERGGVFNWGGGLWTDGIDPSDVPAPESRDQPDIIEPPTGKSPDSGSTTTTTNGTGNGSGDDPTRTTPGDPQFRSRVKDIVQLAPTSNGELADAWGLQTGKEAWQYLNSELDEYYERDTNSKVQPTAKAHKLVSELNKS